MWRVRCFYRRDGLKFSTRAKFMEELRPYINHNCTSARIAYPEAFIFIRYWDVDRAIERALQHDALKTQMSEVCY